MSYVIVYRNDPEFKGMDHYLARDDGIDDTLTSDINNAYVYFNKNEAKDDLKIIKQKIKGYLKPQIVNVLVSIKEKGKC